MSNVDDFLAQNFPQLVPLGVREVARYAYTNGQTDSEKDWSEIIRHAEEMTDAKDPDAFVAATESLMAAVRTRRKQKGG